MKNTERHTTLDNTAEGAYIRANVLSVPEVAEKLHLTKQRIYALINAGQLKPAKADNVTLFSVSEINRFTQNRMQKAQIQNNKSIYPVYFDRFAGSSTKYSELSWAKHKEEIDCIDEIRIYRNSQEAARDGYFQIGSPVFGTLHSFESPSMIIRAKNGVRLWLLSCSCGYDGTGPQGTVRILMDAQKSGLLRTALSKEAWENYVFNKKQCIISQADDEDEMTCHEETQVTRDCEQKLDEAKQLIYPTVQFFARDSHLVLVQSDNPMRSSETEKVFYLQLYMDYIPNPVSFICFPTCDAAKNNGFNGMSLQGKVTGYQIILVDANGTEIWFESLQDSNINLAKNETIRELFLTLGYELPTDEASLPTRIRNWINDQVMKSQPNPATPLIITFDN